MTKDDERYLLEAVTLAEKGAGHTRPNPPVGAVVVKDGKIVGRGWHKKAGGDHAEVAALKDAGDAAKGATVYVTLEPCSKPGRVGACTDALIAAEVKRVVYGAVDPNPKNRNKAKRVLAKAGIECECKRNAPCEKLIAPFKKGIEKSLPYVTVKLAMSLDGRICDDFGDARWVSSPESLKTTRTLRDRVDAIMVGAETIRKDNPSLLRYGKSNKDLIRYVVTRSGKLPRDAKVFTDEFRKHTIVIYVGRKKGTPKSLEWCLAPDGCAGVVSARSLHDALAIENHMAWVMHILCEGGLELARSLAAEGLVDEWITVLAPKVIGHGHIADAAIFAGPDTILTTTKSKRH